MTQPKARPPFFVLFGNSVDGIPESDASTSWTRLSWT